MRLLLDTHIFLWWELEPEKLSTAALGCLADLSEHTQVLYFTHHRHLLDLAREAVGGDLNVIELA